MDGLGDLQSTEVVGTSTGSFVAGLRAAWTGDSLALVWVQDRDHVGTLTFGGLGPFGGVTQVTLNDGDRPASDAGLVWTGTGLVAAYVDRLAGAEYWDPDAVRTARLGSCF